MAQNPSETHAKPALPLTPHQLVAANVEKGLVLDRHGRWVAIEEALVEEVRIRHHLEKGEILLDRHWVSIESLLTASAPAGERPPEEEAHGDTRRVATVRDAEETQGDSRGPDGEAGVEADEELARKTVRLSADGELDLTDSVTEPAAEQMPAAVVAAQPTSGNGLEQTSRHNPDRTAEDWEQAAGKGRRWRLLGIIAAALALASAAWLAVEKFF